MLLVERDRLSAELDNCRELNSITEIVIKTDSTLVFELETKINNLDYIMDAKDKINTLEIDKLNRDVKQLKKERAFIIGSSGLMILILILL